MYLNLATNDRLTSTETVLMDGAVGGLGMRWLILSRLTLEAGHRIDGFGDRTSDFVGLTFTYSNLKDHYNNMYHGKISATQETAQKRGNKGGRLWSIVAPLALGLAVGELMADDSPRTRLASTANTAPGTGNTNNNPPAGNGDKGAPQASGIWSGMTNLMAMP